MKMFIKNFPQYQITKTYLVLNQIYMAFCKAYNIALAMQKESRFSEIYGMVSGDGFLQEAHFFSGASYGQCLEASAKSFVSGSFTAPGMELFAGCVFHYLLQS